MKFYADNDFLQKGSTQVPLSGAKFVAIGIASSSEVDLVNVGGHILSPKGIVPFTGHDPLLSVRGPYTNALEGVTTALDGVKNPGSKLCVQMYEEGDPLVPPGPRAPYVAFANVANMPATPATAALVFRIPFAGRSHAQIHVAGNVFADLSLVIRGVKYAGPPRSTITTPFFDEQAAVDLWNGAGASPTTAVLASGLGLSASWHVGGNADLEEDYDELQVYAWATAAMNTYTFQAEAWGERLK